jgi:hypothetical protein
MAQAVDSEAIGVVVVFLVGIVAKAMESLHGLRQAGDADAGDVAEPREAVSPIGSHRAVLQPLRSRADGVKGDGVKVNTAVTAVSDHEVGGQLVEGDDESEGGKGVAGDWGVAKRNDAIEVIVLPGLLADQSVDTPPTVRPEGDSGILQRGDDSEETPRVHHRASKPPTFGTDSKLT